MHPSDFSSSASLRASLGLQSSSDPVGVCQSPGEREKVRVGREVASEVSVWRENTASLLYLNQGKRENSDGIIES